MIQEGAESIYFACLKKLGVTLRLASARRGCAHEAFFINCCGNVLFQDDMHDEGKRQFLATKTGEEANAKLEDTISPIIRCKGILHDTNGKRVALQGLYEHHEFFELGNARPPSTARADTDTASSDSCGKESPSQNQLVFIGPITAKFQATIRAAAIACFTNAEVWWLFCCQ